MEVLTKLYFFLNKEFINSNMIDIFQSISVRT